MVRNESSNISRVKRLAMSMARLARLQERYLLTKKGGIRLRYMAVPVVAAVLMSGWALSSTISALSGHAPVVAMKRSPVIAATSYRYVDGVLQLEAGTIEIAKPVKKPEPVLKPLEARTDSLKIGKGDTLAGILQKSGFSGGEAYQMVEALSEHYDPRKMRPGQVIKINYQPNQKTRSHDFNNMTVALDSLRAVNVTKNNSGEFSADLNERETVTHTHTGRAEIEVSLYGSGLKAGIPSSVIAETIRIYSWDVDFQRDIRRGDLMEVMYEQLETKDGEAVKTGDILYARLNVNGQDIPVYRYEMKNGDTDYFTADGASIRKALMTTPINGARLSSGFGRRKHPVLGYTKMHKGVDFAAARGTPIYAAGDGTIERAGPFSSYGNYVRIRHNSSIKTAYAHMKGFAKGIRSGARVKQGQVIGYVGTTGRSTGPHLHYEVLQNGAQINPRKAKLPQGEVLKGTELANFKAHMSKVKQRYAQLSGKSKYAFLR